MIAVVKRKLKHGPREGATDQNVGCVVIKMPLLKRASRHPIWLNCRHQFVQPGQRLCHLLAQPTIFTVPKVQPIFLDSEVYANRGGFRLPDRCVVQPEDMNFRSAQAKATNECGDGKLIIRMRKNEHPALPWLE